MTCPKCNVPDIPDNARFCPQCGATVAADPPRTSSLFSRAMIVVLGLLALLVAAAIFWEAGPWRRYIALVPPPSDLGQQAIVLHDKLEGYERSADTLKTLVTFMISLSTLYALALALNAYIGVQEATKRAEQSVKSLNDLQQNAKVRYDRDLLEIRREFPLFREMQSRIGDILDALLRLNLEPGFGLETVKNISPIDKVKLTHYERTVASFEFFNLAPFREEASRIYQLLGSFHSHKWLLDKESGATSDDADKGWARFYLMRGHDLKRDDVATLNDLGFFELKVTAEWDLARKHLTASRDLDPQQQRPRYFLSICEHLAGDLERRKGNADAAKKHYTESVELLTTALGKKRWQQETPEARARHADYLKRMTCYLNYNRACAEARLAEFEVDPASQSQFREKAVADLKNAFPSGTIPLHAEQLARDFQQDTNAGGDLFGLVQSQWGDEVKQLIDEVRNA